MLRYALLASALAFSAPVLAQEMTPQAADPSTAAATAPQSAPEAATPDAATAAPAPAQQPQTAQAAQPTSVAEVVKAEFPAYDKDSTGDLSKDEFSTWLIALKTKSDPSAAADQTALSSWAGQAFAQADADKSSAVTETELTTFLGG